MRTGHGPRNYVMAYLLSYLLSKPSLLEKPGANGNLISPNIASDAHLSLLAGTHLRINAGFLLALACAAGVWWLMSRSTLGFEFRTVGANPNAARSAGMSVPRTWIIVMLIAGGLAGLSASTVIQGTDFSLNFQSYGTYGIDAITVALLGRARPGGVVLAALLFGALHAGAPLMQATTQTPVDIVQVIQALIVIFVAAFAGAVFASAFGVLWLGLIAGSLAGGLVGLLLGIFAITYLVDQIILGVVLNVLVSGLTGYLYDKLLVPYANTLNSPSTYLPIKIPLLGDIPIIGPVFFDSTLFLYITYILIAAVQVGLFSTRWGLRVRAVGEHPAAADTVGISVRLTRYRNVILAGLVAGIGGAFLTIGSVGSFGKDMSSGKGYIALAAMIFGRWTPLGGVGAALLFGFTFELQSILSTINVPVPSDFLLMVPYVATIIAVAGLVGQVKAPAADGQPYITS